MAISFRAAPGLGMRRLSIVDLATGHQPISNEDGTLWMVFNGEIYNHRDLREQLIKRGAIAIALRATPKPSFTSTRSTGSDCVQHLPRHVRFRHLGHAAAEPVSSLATGWASSRFTTG